jgi:uncharacterized protein involved in exopolysaccharide biosynthesis
MEEEIDLRQYITVLMRRWYWIAGLALAAAVVAFGVSSILPPTYEATALVVVTQPRYLFQFDSRVQATPLDLAAIRPSPPAMTCCCLLPSRPIPPCRRS